MKHVILLMIALTGNLFGGEGAIASFFQAEKLADAGQNREAARLYEESGDAAVRENLPYYVFASGYHGSILYNNLVEPEKARKLATRGVKAFEEGKKEGETWANTSWSRSSVLGMMSTLERSDQFDGKLGEAWKKSREAMALWKVFSSQPPGDELDPKRIAGLALEPRAFGWRFCEREADYLHEVGRTREALDLLGKAIEAAEDDFRSPDHFLRSYALRLLSAKAGMHGFLAEEPMAIALLERKLSFLILPVDEREMLRCRLNLLLERRDLQELEEKDFQEAEEIRQRVVASGWEKNFGLERIMVQINGDRMDRAERLASLAKAQEGDTSVMEEFYAKRELLFERSMAEEGTLDAEFFELLEGVRRQGNKRAEPRIYRRYGDWLFEQERYDEAYRYYRESLKLSHSFGWVQVPLKCYELLARVCLAKGDLAAARALWAQSERYIQSEEGLLPHVFVRAMRLRLWALLRAGMAGEAEQLARRVLQFSTGKNLSPSDLIDFESHGFAALSKVLKEHQFIVTEDDGKMAEVSFQPLEIVTVAQEGDPARSVFYLLNFGSREAVGELVVTAAAGVSGGLGEEGGMTFAIGDDGAGTERRIEVSVSAGEMREVFLTAEGAAGEATLGWQAGGEVVSQSRWQYSWGERAKEVTVLEAAALASNPFASIPLLHHFALGGKERAVVRMKSGQPIRIEYRDPTTGELLAVDANGNGDFRDAGDFSQLMSPEAPATGGAPIVNPEGDGERIEFWLFQNGIEAKDDFEIQVEVYVDGEWRESGSNVVRSR